VLKQKQQPQSVPQSYFDAMFAFNLLCLRGDFFTKSRIFCEKRSKLSDQAFPKNAAPPSWFV
jgi:hypothetical protein